MVVYTQMFISAHYAGEDMVMKVKAGESWKKVFGPVFTYLNCLPDQTSDPLSLWQDAKNQVYSSNFGHIKTYMQG